jgi:hypothetical protein
VVIVIKFYGINCGRGIGLVFVGILPGNFCGGNEEDQENCLSLVCRPRFEQVTCRIWSRKECLRAEQWLFFSYWHHARKRKNVIYLFVHIGSNCVCCTGLLHSGRSCITFTLVLTAISSVACYQTASMSVDLTLSEASFKEQSKKFNQRLKNSCCSHKIGCSDACRVSRQDGPLHYRPASSNAFCMLS